MAARLSMRPKPRDPLPRSTRLSIQQTSSYDPLLPLLQPIHDDGSTPKTSSHRALMATITIPSPSAFLDSPVIQPTPTPNVSHRATSKKRTPTKAHQSSAKRDIANGKPKQTKSRDGTRPRIIIVLSWISWYRR